MKEVNEQPKTTVEDIYTGYGPMTMVSGWSYSAESYPRDRPDDEHNQAISTYKRLGIFDSPTPSSVTRSDQESAQSLPRPSKPYRPMVNVVSYPYLFTENRREIMERIGFKPPPRGYGRTDYMTTMQSSYVNYVEGPMSRPPPKSEVYKPETKYRRLMTDPFNIRRPNLGMFLDDNMDYLKDMRRSFHPMRPPFGLDYQPTWTWDLPIKK